MLPLPNLEFSCMWRLPFTSCTDGISGERQPLKYWFRECFTLSVFLSVTVSFLSKFLVPLLFSLVK